MCWRNLTSNGSVRQGMSDNDEISTNNVSANPYLLYTVSQKETVACLIFYNSKKPELIFSNFRQTMS